MKKISEEIRQKVAKLHRDGMTYNQIKESTGLGKGTISNICQEINGKVTPIELTEDKIKELQELYDKLGSIKKVAQISGISYGRLRNVIISKTVTPKSKDYLKKHRKEIKQKLIDYKGGKCARCGYNLCNEALEFHHLNPEEKEFTLSVNHQSFDKLKLEADKCILLCCRCHRELHAGLWNPDECI